MSTLVRELEPGWFGKTSYPREERQCACGTVFVSTPISGQSPELEDKQVCATCRCEREQQDQREQRRLRLERMTEESIPPRYNAIFDTSELASRVKPPSMIERAKAALRARLIVLQGPAGSGKTTLACALLRQISASRNTVGRFATTFDLAECRRQHRLGQGEAAAIERSMSAAVLALDEIGAEKTNDTAIQEIIRHRHDAEMVTIYTTGFTQAEIATKYDAGIERRIFEGATLLRLGGGK